MFSSVAVIGQIFNAKCGRVGGWSILVFKFLQFNVKKFVCKFVYCVTAMLVL